MCLQCQPRKLRETKFLWLPLQRADMPTIFLNTEDIKNLTWQPTPSGRTRQVVLSTMRSESTRAPTCSRPWGSAAPRLAYEPAPAPCLAPAASQPASPAEKETSFLHKTKCHSVGQPDVALLYEKEASAYKTPNVWWRHWSSLSPPDTCPKNLRDIPARKDTGFTIPYQEDTPFSCWVLLRGFSLRSHWEVLGDGGFSLMTAPAQRHSLLDRELRSEANFSERDGGQKSLPARVYLCVPRRSDWYLIADRVSRVLTDYPVWIKRTQTLLSASQQRNDTAVSIYPAAIRLSAFFFNKKLTGL